MVPVLFTSYVPSMLLKKMANWNMNVTGAIKLLGTPMEKKWARHCPLHKLRPTYLNTRPF